MYKVTDIRVEEGVLHFKGFDKPQTRGAGFGTAEPKKVPPRDFRIELDPSSVQLRPGYYSVRVLSGLHSSKHAEIDDEHDLYPHLEQGMGY